MPSARYLISILVTAQIVSYACGEFMNKIHEGFLAPLGKLICGGDLSIIYAGPFDIRIVIAGLISSIITILISMLLLSLTLHLTWKWIYKLLPPMDEANQ